MVWPRPSSLPDDAETRHHCSVSSALHIMPFLSMTYEPLPPHPHELYLQTPRSFFTIDVVPSGVNEPMLSEEIEERNSVIKTSAYNFLGHTTKFEV